jgi:SnoaL-like domain
MSTITTTHTSFDVAAFRRALEALDGAAVAAFVAEEFERVEIDQTTPPSAPAVVRGREANAAALADLRARGVQIQTEEPLVDGNRLAMLSRCTLPDGQKVVGIAIGEISDGLLARWTEVQAWG